MNDTRTMEMLQRVPHILAVTAHSYGLHPQAGGTRKPAAAGERREHGREKGDKPTAQK